MIKSYKSSSFSQELETSSEDEDISQPPPPSQSNRGGRGGGRGRGHGNPSAPQKPDGYTGGRDRQMKERHKADFKQRGADRKKRGAY